MNLDNNNQAVVLRLKEKVNTSHIPADALTWAKALETFVAALILIKEHDREDHPG